MSRARSIRARVWLAQALYFGIGGVWAVVGRHSFEAITGPKVDYWLVRTVGGLLAAIGAVIGLAGMRDRLTPEIRWLGIAASATLTAIDVTYTASGRLRPVYLLDALANALIIGGWLAGPDGDDPA